MRYIIKNGLKCHWNFKLLPKDFRAITLFGHIFFNDPKDVVLNYLGTVRGEVTINHEKIHTIQAASFKTKYFGFYVYYLYYWFIGLFKYGVKNNASYKMIPFEIEAVINQYDFTYNKTEWRKYIP